MKIYIVVRSILEGPDFQTIDLFYSAHLTRESAEIAVEKYREIPFDDEPDFQILESEAT